VITVNQPPEAQFLFFLLAGKIPRTGNKYLQQKQLAFIWY